jgi:lipoprotein-releasing system permease protein
MKRLMPFAWIAAFRFLREGWMQSVFILAGVAMGVAVIVFMSALMASSQANFLRRVLSAQAHIVMLPQDEVARPLRVTRPPQAARNVLADPSVQRPAQRLRSIDQWQVILRQLLSMPEVLEATPVASGAALAVRGEASRSITLNGVESETYFRIVLIPENMVAGAVRLGTDDVLIGTELGAQLGVGIGDKIRISAAGGREATLTVTGIFDLGNKSVNERTTYVALRTAQSLLGLIGGVTSIQITVADIWAAEILAERIRGLAGVKVESWIATNQQFFTAINAQETMITMIRLAVGLSVALGIASVLVVSVVQRSREIGILRAMGAGRGQILRVFLIQGGVLGFFGAVIGASLAFAALRIFHAVVRQADGKELFPLIIDPWLFVVASALAALTGVLAAMAPALRAARLDPVVAIRG